MLVRELFERLQRRLEIGEPTLEEILRDASVVRRWTAFVHIRSTVICIIGTDDVPAEPLFLRLIRDAVHDQIGTDCGPDDPLSDQDNYRQALNHSALSSWPKGWLEREVRATGGTSVP